ncbi:MAG: glutathione S-transferase family protein [Gammaproteobacteria bacterium]
MKYVVLGVPLSPFVRKVRVFCAEKGIDYELEPISPFEPPEGWREISPLGRIPVLALVDDDGSRRYLPDSSVICAFLEQMHPEPSLIPIDPIARGDALWLEEYADSELAGVIGLGIFRPVVLARLTGGEPDLAKARDTVDHRMSFVNMGHAGFAPDEKRWPRFSAFLERMHGRDSFAACIEQERRILAR